LSTASDLSNLTWTAVPEGATVLVPLGSTEQHGPHLPFATDAIVAAAVAHAAAQRLNAAGDRTIVAPVLPYGASGEHQAFAGTVSIGHEALRAVLIEIVRSLATWASRIIIVNGHGGNAPTVNAVVDQMRFEGHELLCVMCAAESSTDAHAGFDETSIMLQIQPNLVDVDAIAPGNTQPLGEILADLMEHGVRPVSPNGVLGNPRNASAEIGDRLLAEMVARVVEVARGR